MDVDHVVEHAVVLDLTQTRVRPIVHDGVREGVALELESEGHVVVLALPDVVLLRDLDNAIFNAERLGGAAYHVLELLQARRGDFSPMRQHPPMNG